MQQVSINRSISTFGITANKHSYGSLVIHRFTECSFCKTEFSDHHAQLVLLLVLLLMNVPQSIKYGQLSRWNKLAGKLQKAPCTYVRQAAEAYMVPISTLLDRVTGRTHLIAAQLDTCLMKKRLSWSTFWLGLLKFDMLELRKMFWQLSIRLLLLRDYNNITVSHQQWVVEMFLVNGTHISL